MVPADVRWISGDVLICDPTCAWKRGSGNDFNRELVILGRNVTGTLTSRARGCTEKAGVRNRFQRKADEHETQHTPSCIDASTLTACYDNKDGQSDDAMLSTSEGVRIIESLEVAAGAVVLTGTRRDGTPSIQQEGGKQTTQEAEVEVLRVGGASSGWRAVATWSAEQEEWRQQKEPKCIPENASSLALVIITLAIAIGVHCILASNLPFIEMKDLASFRDLLHSIQKGIFNALFMSEDDSTEEETPRSEVNLIRKQAAADQGRALLHVGLVILGWAIFGSKLLIDCSEAAVNRLAAQRGAILRKKSSGCRFQRLAEIDTILFAHSDAMSEDNNVRVNIPSNVNPRSPTTASSASSTAASSTSSSPGIDATISTTPNNPAQVLSSKDASAVFRLTSMLGLDVKIACNIEGATGKSRSVPMVKTLKDLGLPAADEHVVLNTALRLREELESTTRPKLSIECCTGFVLSPENKMQTKKISQEDSQVAALSIACELVQRLQRIHGRRLLVTADDSPNGCTEALLLAADVGVIAGNRFMTGKKQSASNDTQRIIKASKAKNEGEQKHDSTPKKTNMKLRQAFYGGDVALKSGLPVGMSPLADIITLARACCRAQHGAQFGRVANVATCTTLIAFQVCVASTFILFHIVGDSYHNIFISHFVCSWHRRYTYLDHHMD